MRGGGVFSEFYGSYIAICKRSAKRLHLNGNTSGFCP